MTRTIPRCLCCEGEVVPLVDFGPMPLANTYGVRELFPLQVNRCVDCFHLQLSQSVDPNVLYRDYVYCSGTSRTAFEFFDEFAGIALEYYPEAMNVLDIASNDGSQLDAFQRRGLATSGIDPAENLAAVASAKGHKVRAELFEHTDMGGEQFDLITAQNVLAHTPDPLAFLLGCARLMHDDSRLFVMTSQADMIINRECDTIYHEHISYFNTRSMLALARRAGLVMIDLQMHPIHGTSYLFVFGKSGRMGDGVAERLAHEDSAGLFSEGAYADWFCAVDDRVDALRCTIRDFRNVGVKTVGCGAAAKGISMLNMAGVRLDYLIDTTPTKWNKVASGMPIKPFEALAGEPADELRFVVLAWNLYDEIVETVRRYRNNPRDQFITTRDVLSAL